MNEARIPNQDLVGVIINVNVDQMTYPGEKFSARNMTFYSDWDSRSMATRPSDFKDGAEIILMNTSSKIEAQGGDDGDSQSRSSTPESHKEFCLGSGAYGQGAPVYSCGCYRYSEMRRYTHIQPSPPNLEQVCLTRKLYEAVLMFVIAGIGFWQ
jgi:hypothetical protein